MMFSEKEEELEVRNMSNEKHDVLMIFLRENEGVIAGTQKFVGFHDFLLLFANAMGYMIDCLKSHILIKIV
jgi:hypothetical protein